MDDSLLGPDPAQLAVGDEVAPGGAHVDDEGGEAAVQELGGKGGDGEADDVVAPADGEG